MIKIDIKPLSINKCWKGRRFKTKDYKEYEYQLLCLLPNNKKELFGKLKLKLEVEVGYSSKNADVDNMLKPFIDVLQAKYCFNDRQIYEINIKKTDVNKKEEYIKFIN